MEGETLELTPRERFFRAVEHKEVDRVPIDFGGAAESSVACSIIDAPPYGYRALCKYLGITDYAPPEVSFILRSVTNVDERILKKFNVDFRDVPPPDHSKFKPEVLPNGYVRGEHGILWKPGYATGGYICVPDHETPFRYGKTIKDVEEYPYWSKVNVPQLEKYASELYKKAKELHENTDYVITGGGGPFSVHTSYMRLCGFDRFFIDIKTNPEFYHAVCERLLEYELETRKIILGAIGDYVDRVWVGDDMGTQVGGFLSLKDFREFVLPYWEKVVKTTKKYAPNAKVIIHCCGSIHPYIRDMAKIGIDILNGLQPQAANMDVETLKRDFGDIICFHGGIDVQKVLPFGTPEDVREWTKRYIRTLAPGYIMAPSHNIGPEVPPQNICAAYETAQTYTPWR
ncbi:hypothetical protein DRO35_04275 [Candidatus Bathyarchaeota archaeon]|nr:MAG: hypothetical protein DRO35_04275 [Candidatus Bathyarchaeota archaeon]